MKYDCIMLGAGLSTRMGKWKLLMDFHCKSIIEHALDNAQIYTNRILLSGGYRIDDLRRHLKQRENLTIVDNKKYERGMLTSVKEAVKLVETDKFFITLGDMPLIPPEVFLKMSNAVFPEVLFPVYKGMRGHPVLMDISLKNEILNAPDHLLMKEILNRHIVTEMEVEFEGILLDIDTETEYNRLLNENEIN